MKRVSVITITRNNSEGLRSTLESILALDKTGEVEVIVIDGHSTDGTMDVVEEFDPLVSIFEQDNGEGIYQAMNQGVASASGEYVIFMNAGDCFIGPDVLREIMPFLGKDLVFGRAFHEGGSEQFPYEGFERCWARMPFGHQSVFIRRQLLVDHPHDLSFRISADFDFILWTLASGKSFCKTEVRIARIEAGGISDDRLVRRVRECYRAARRYHSEFAMHLFYLRKLKWAYLEEKRRVKLKSAEHSPSV